MARMGIASTWTACMALTLTSGCTTSGPETAATQNGGNGGAGTTSSSVAATTGSGGGSSFNCDPPADPGSIYELTAVSYDINQIDPVSMCQYRGEVMLIVNTAAV